MKTFKQFMVEAVTQQVAKAAAGQAYQKQALQQKVNPSGSQPTISRTRLYHGTDSQSSQAINRGGWRTDTNVSRQMTGSGVYTTPQRSAAQMYANQRASQRGTQPAVRTFSIPTSTFKKVQTQRQQADQWNFNKGGKSFNAMQMTPKGANKYDVTNNSLTRTIRPQGSQRQELNQRVNTALQKPQAREILNRRYNIKAKKGGTSSLENAGNPGGEEKTSRLRGLPKSMDYTPGAGGNYGISGIGLAN